MKDQYHVTDGRNERTFDFTPEGLRAAWAFQQTLRGAQLTNPNRVDLRADDSGLDDGITDDEQEQLDEFETEAFDAVRRGLKTSHEDGVAAGCDALGIEHPNQYVNDLIASVSRDLMAEEDAAEGAYWDQRIDEARGK